MSDEFPTPKYKVGDRVWTIHTDYDNVKCYACGHVETDYENAHAVTECLTITGVKVLHRWTDYSGNEYNFIEYSVSSSSWKTTATMDEDSVYPTEQDALNSLNDKER